MPDNHYNCIYKLTSPSGKVYIGQTVNFNQRMRKHKHAYPGCTKLISAINKYGWENFKKEILIENLKHDELNEYEIKYIEEYDSVNSGYNVLIGGDVQRTPTGHGTKYGTGTYRLTTLDSDYKKEWAEINKDRLTQKRKDYYQNNKTTIREKQKEYYNRLDVKEKQKEKHKEYYEKNKPKIREKKKEYDNRPDIKEKMKVYYKEYGIAHREHKREYDKQYRESHRDKQREYQKEYRQRPDAIERNKENQKRYRERHKEEIDAKRKQKSAIKKAIEQNNGQMVLDTYLK